jgi:hypothetical protein
MTAIRDAMKSAGVNTAGAELYAEATKCLQKPATAGKTFRATLMGRDDLLAALIKMREDLLTTGINDYLVEVSADMKGVPRWQPDRAPSPTPAAAAQKPEARPQPAAAPAPRKDDKITVGAYERKAHNDRISRQAAKNAWNSEVFAMEISGRKIGDMSFAEIGRLRSESAHEASDWLHYGTQRAMHAILLNKIAGYAQVQDQTVKISQVIPAAQLEKYVEEAKLEALGFVRDRAGKYAKELEEGKTATAPPREIESHVD